MRVFSAPLQEFRHKLLTNELFLELDGRFPLVTGYTVGPSEASSWRSSLPRLEAALRLAELPEDVFITIEERIPYFSKRIDACLWGHTKDDTPYSVIVELKGWAAAEASDDGNVRPNTSPTPRPRSAAITSTWRTSVAPFRVTHASAWHRAHTATTTPGSSPTRVSSIPSSTICAPPAPPLESAMLCCWPAT